MTDKRMRKDIGDGVRPLSQGQSEKFPCEGRTPGNGDNRTENKIIVPCAIRTRAYKGMPMRLECNPGRAVNTISTVAKDSMIMEIAVETTPPRLFGSSRLNALIASGKVKTDRLLFLDCYNQLVYEVIAPTITTRIDASNMYFISEKTDG